MVRWQVLCRTLVKRAYITRLCFVFTACFIGSLAIWQLRHRGSSQLGAELLPRVHSDNHLRAERLIADEQHEPVASFNTMELTTFGQHRLVHLDLKGAPPKISYVEQLLPVLKKWGATGLLVEWEDTFPYWGEQLAAVGSSGPDSPGLYTRQELETLLALAASHNLEVVPLIQTFGHFEFVLKHDEFRRLREVPSFPSSLCPSNPDTLPLVQAMLAQVISLHPGLRTLHIGADEVWHLGMCDACRARMAHMPSSQHSSAKDRLFLEHVHAVLRWLRTEYSGVQLLMWDDMLRHMDPLLLQEYELGKLVEPMVWHYRPSKTFHLPHDLWSKYGSVFQGVWVATAFKGASGSNMQLPWLSQHLDCQERWLQELREQQHKGTLPPVRGVAITGWSRYDHYAVMCELLPAGLPSLALCLAQWQAGAFTLEVHKNVSMSLGYPSDQLISLQPQPHQEQLSLTFPGWKIRSGVEWLVAVQAKVTSVTSSEQSQTWLNPFLVSQSFSNPARVLSLRSKYKRIVTWLSPWLCKNNFTNPMQLTSLCHNLPTLLDELARLENFLRPALEAVFPPLVVEEWVGTTLEPGRERLRQLLHEAERQVALGGRTRGYHAMA